MLSYALNMTQIVSMVMWQRLVKFEEYTKRFKFLIGSDIIWQIGYCIGGSFNIHIWVWSASPSVQLGRL